jgi:hypothetical protein
VHGRTVAVGALSVTLVVIGAVIAGVLSTGGTRAPLDVSARASVAGPPGVAAAYGYPSRCVSVTIDASDPAYARADLDRATQCGRYGGSVTAIFHRASGRWRMAFDAVDYSCPVAGLPRSVQAELDVCLPVGR